MAKKNTASKKADVKRTVKTGTAEVPEKYVKAYQGISFWSGKEAGDHFEGTYLETMRFRDKYSKDKDGMANRPVFKSLDDDKQYALPANYSIMRAIEEHGKTDYFIIYEGKEGKSKEYPKGFHKYEVLVDEKA